MFMINVTSNSIGDPVLIYDSPYQSALGCILSMIWILHFFGTRLKPKTKPKIKINIPPLIQDSHIILFNKVFYCFLQNRMTKIVCKNKFFV